MSDEYVPTTKDVRYGYQEQWATITERAKAEAERRWASQVAMFGFENASDPPVFMQGATFAATITAEQESDAHRAIFDMWPEAANEQDWPVDDIVTAVLTAAGFEVPS